MRSSLLIAYLVLAACAGADPDRQAVAPSPSPHTLVTLGSMDGSTATAQALSGPTLTLDQLRACFEETRQIERDRATVDEMHASLEQRRTAIEATQDRLQIERTSLDAHDAAAVNNLNLRIGNAQSSINDYNHDAAMAHATQTQANDRVNAFNRDCAGHSYYRDDYEKIAKDYGDVVLPH